MNSCDIVDALDNVAVALWMTDGDERYPIYEGETRKHYRRMAREAIKVIQQPSLLSVQHNLLYFGKFGRPKATELLRAYQGILTDIVLGESIMMETHK
jgi:hypothetical protein